MSSPTSLDFDDHESDPDAQIEHTGNYASRMQELLDDDEDLGPVQDESDEDEGFLYDGVDADTSAETYRDRLADVLGEDIEEHEREQVGKSLIIDQTGSSIEFEDDEPLRGSVMSEASPTTSSIPLATPPRIGSPVNGSPLGTPSKFNRPFLHPNVSRLRSFTPQGSSLNASTSSVGTSRSMQFGIGSPAASHFSSMSRGSSESNLRATEPGHQNGHLRHKPREVFSWTELRNIGNQIFSPRDNKASSLLGGPSAGYPTVITANGMICIGTDEGKIYVYDFKQTLKGVCGNDASARTLGPVTSLALSFDHTYVASGHSSGYIQLYDLKNPNTPARSVPPTTLAAVSSGRKEGHIFGSRIVNIGFIAGRHTALVSADEHGLAFYHSLGKVLFVEASDILRILGKYQLDGPIPPTPLTPLDSASFPSSNHHRKSRYTILAMAPLPLGPVSHPTDTYHVIALLTPTKLVVVGLKPTPKTWFKCLRGSDTGETKAKSRYRGTLSWFPSSSTTPADQTPTTKSHVPGDGSSTFPTLAFTWGQTIRIIRLFEKKAKQTVRNARTGKSSEVDTGSIDFEDKGTWSAEEDILAMQWLNVNQVIVVTASTLDVYDTKLSKPVEHIQFDGLSLISPSLSHTVNGAISYADSVGEISHSLRVYKGKIFTLGRDKVKVGTLLTWADRILSCVQEGDFLSAIDLTRTYYTGDFVGNSNGLPDDLQLRREVVGEKMRELMVASARYAFSEDRMTDSTHVTPDGRGVDRTALFEGLVSTCATASVTLDDFDFFFEDLFQQYDDTGIAKIFLLQLEPFVLNNDIRYVPPRITQRLVALHSEGNRPDLVERIIWHIDPTCLDLNQTINLCQKHQLYDALIYIYTAALKDYIAPVVELLNLIRKVRQYRKLKEESFEPWMPDEDPYIEPLVINAYKVYPYLTNILSGLTYPSETPLDIEEASQARKAVYTFLFFGRSSVWPAGPGGKLVLTADEDGGVEPTYPYVRQLLRFDSESFLHTLDVAFEDSYLNDDSQSVSRLVIVRILLDILSSGSLSPADTTFVNIFIARNVPKYPQFLHLPPTSLHSIIVGLAEDPDPNTREDRQLAAEFLLSAYNPHESERIVELFMVAGFFRILRAWHRQERNWVPLIATYLEDHDIRATEMFESIDEILTTATRSNHGQLPPELRATIVESIPQLLQSGLSNTADLFEKHQLDLHDEVLRELGDNADHKKFIYLRQLLGLPSPEEVDYPTQMDEIRPSRSISPSLRQLFISLQCRFYPKELVNVLKVLPEDLLDWSEVVESCESNDAYDAVVWTLNNRGDPTAALAKAEQFEKKLTVSIVDILTDRSSVTSETLVRIQQQVESLEAVGQTGVDICMERSLDSSGTEVPLEDIWFQLLSSQLNCVQSISECCSDEALAGKPDQQPGNSLAFAEWQTLNSLRSLVQATFGALVSITSTRAVSFPRLFKRLVNSTTHINATGTRYTEFRTILTGMLESYRSDGDILIITKHLVDRDLFETVASVTKERARGWSPFTAVCSLCGKSLIRSQKGDSSSDDKDRTKLIVSRTGTLQHSTCPSL